MLYFARAYRAQNESMPEVAVVHDEVLARESIMTVLQMSERGQSGTEWGQRGVRLSSAEVTDWGRRLVVSVVSDCGLCIRLRGSLMVAGQCRLRSSM